MPRILIIEDERPMRTALEDTLSAEGHRVLSAADGAAGLDKALAEKPDLILLDVMMPKLDGFAVCAELRRLGVATPVLINGVQHLVHPPVISRAGPTLIAARVSYSSCRVSSSRRSKIRWQRSIGSALNVRMNWVWV